MLRLVSSAIDGILISDRWKFLLPLRFSLAFRSIFRSLSIFLITRNKFSPIFEKDILSLSLSLKDPKINKIFHFDIFIIHRSSSSSSVKINHLSNLFINKSLIPLSASRRNAIVDVSIVSSFFFFGTTKDPFLPRRRQMKRITQKEG